ncbi:MAG: PaaI family thioesterase [Fimbriimonadaceae bacterium]|nr:PaaI family thioesterase [Alphaproteobacteria bacterium]
MTEHPNFVAERNAGSGFQKLLGYQLTRWEPGYAEISLDLRPDHLNRADMMHGGLTTTLLDSAFGYAACFCNVPGHVRRCVTLSLTTTYMGQADHGVIRAIGRLRGGGRRIVMCAGEIRNGDGDVLAIGEGVYRYRSGSDDPDGVPDGRQP